METRYSHKDIEDSLYQYWENTHLFSSEPDEREAYTIVMPPPNVTGVLHMGHVLNATTQDILVRRAHLEGKNTSWVPGTDHASIATEAKVIKDLKLHGIKKEDLTREEFLQYAWAWKDRHGSIILQQLRKLGCACDWDKLAFTMDEKRSEAVLRVFCDLYKKGLIYRGYRMVNWDPERQTALSDEEVIYKEEHSHLYYLKYRVLENVDDDQQSQGKYRDDKGWYALIATTRPETIMGDVAVCINPNDTKNQWLRNKHVIVPLVNRVIPIIEDEYVDIHFGTGCLKVTPAHDSNDYTLGQKHNLPSIDIFTPDAHISPTAELYVGLDRFECRKQIVSDLKNNDLLEKIDDYTNNVGYSERTNVPIEPRLSLQWFLRMEHFAQMALPPVMNNEITFYPSKYKNIYRNWLENIRDWCISRQLWWGHRIPAYFLVNKDSTREDNETFVVAMNKEEAIVNMRNLLLEKGRVEEAKNIQEDDLIQDQDVLDTWFSSWLWPISLFDGISHPDNKQMQYYYPTADLVTGPDIIFFWVARMIMAGYEYTGKPPFRNVYFTGIVRDKMGRKMSKSLGNSPDPLDLIEKYGADGVRMGIMLCAPAGNDILFDENLCEQGRNFCNKIWNCFRLMSAWKPTLTEESPANTIACQWMENILLKTETEIAQLFNHYRLNEALMQIYKLFWDNFSAWFLEMIKPLNGTEIEKTTYDTAWRIWGRMLQLLHPFMPFITEKLWREKQINNDSILKSVLHTSTNEIWIEDTTMNLLLEMVSAVRSLRKQKNIPQKETLPLYITKGQKNFTFPEGYGSLLAKLANIEKIERGEPNTTNASFFVIDTFEFALPIGRKNNIQIEQTRLEAELEHQVQFLASVNAKLTNERFLQHAKPDVIDLERKKQHDAKERITILQNSLRRLKDEQ